MLGVAFLTAAVSAEAQQTVTEFPLPQLAGGSPSSLVLSPDRVGLWFAETSLNKIVQILPSGQVSSFATSPGTAPTDLFGGLSGQIWFSEPGLSRLGRLTISTARSGGANPIMEFPTPTANSGPGAMTRDSDDNLWFVENTANQIGEIGMQGNFLGEFPIPTANAGIPSLTLGPDNALWFVETNGNKIGRIDTSGAIAEFTVPTPDAGLNGVIVGPDSALWFTEKNAGQIGRIMTNGSISEFPITTRSGGPLGLADGADNNIWFVENTANQIGVMTTGGTMVAEFPIPTANSGAANLRIALDQSFWFLEPTANKLGRLTLDGKFMEFAIPTANSRAINLTVGPDQAMWFTEAINQIGHATAFDSSVDLTAAVLPGARSVQTGTTATAFATIINAGTATGMACRIGLNAPLVDFHYQTTNPANNAATGTPDTPVDIGPGVSQSFVISLTRDLAIQPTFFDIGYFCANSNPAPVYVGVDTITLRISDTLPPDIIAVAATATNDGIVDVPSATGTGAFAIATTNIGASATITAQVFLTTTGADLPISLGICQTNPRTAVCLAPPAQSVTTVINQGDQPTFSVFATGSGTVPFDPVNNRINVFFVQNDVISGLTSVAVRTH